MRLVAPPTIKRQFNSPLALLENTSATYLPETPISHSKRPKSPNQSIPHFIPPHLQSYPLQTLQSLIAYTPTIPSTYISLSTPSSPFHKLFKCAVALNLKPATKFAIFDNFHKISSNFDISTKFAPIACSLVSICAKFDPNFGQFLTLQKVSRVLFGANQPPISKLVTWEYTILDSLDWRVESINAYSFCQFFGAGIGFTKIQSLLYEYILILGYLEGKVYLFKPVRLAAAGASLVLERYKGVKWCEMMSKWCDFRLADIYEERDYLIGKWRESEVVKGFMNEFYCSSENYRVGEEKWRDESNFKE